VEKGYLDADTWDKVQATALTIFRRGQTLANAAGFVLVDTKYEFGRAADGTLMLIDEVHTPDSSRFWRAEEAGTEAAPEPWDKEYVRLWYSRRGYRGDGQPPALPDTVVAETAGRYIALFEGITDQAFQPAPAPAEPRIIKVLSGYLE
jgi:phosphoribosylaminoimidazole-succinocarboxamide synthase